MIMKKYSTVLFDIDNTLLNFDAGERNAVIKTLNMFSVATTDEIINKYVKINDGLWKEFEKGKITKDDIKNNRFKILFDEIGHVSTVSAREVNDKYTLNLSEEGILLDGALELCKKLKRIGYKLYAVTNGIEHVQKKRLRKSGLESVMDNVFISEKIGFQKPMKEYFDYVFENITEKDKSKIILVGDSISSDITGAVNAGIDCVWLNLKKVKNTGTAIPTHEVFSINEILNTLE